MVLHCDVIGSVPQSFMTRLLASTSAHPHWYPNNNPALGVDTAGIAVIISTMEGTLKVILFNYYSQLLSVRFLSCTV